MIVVSSNLILSQFFICAIFTHDDYSALYSMVSSAMTSGTLLGSVSSTLEYDALLGLISITR